MVRCWSSRMGATVSSIGISAPVLEIKIAFGPLPSASPKAILISAPVLEIKIAFGLALGKGPKAILISKTGAEIPIDETVAPIRDDQQRTIGAVLVFRDVTERQQAE